jgi:hypothetical protein
MELVDSGGPETIVLKAMAKAPRTATPRAVAGDDPGRFLQEANRGQTSGNFCAWRPVDPPTLA